MNAFPRRKAISKALFGLGLLLPLLAGGNALFLLEPEDGIRYFIAAALGTTWLVVWTGGRTSLVRPAQHSAPQAIAALLLAALVTWWCATLANRPFGPRAITDAQGLFCGALLYGVLSSQPLRAGEIRSFVAGLLAGTLITAIYAQYQYWIMYPRVTVLLRPLGREPIVAINANFYNANCYAPFVAAVIVLSIVLWKNRSTRLVRRLSAAGSLALMGTLALTESRAAILLLLLVALGLSTAMLRSAGRRFCLVLIGGASLLLVLAGWAAAARQNLSELWQVGTLGRIAIWRGAWAMISDHWRVGVGLGQFAEQFERYRVTTYYTRYPHNLFLEVFAETGITGIITLVSFLAITVAVAAHRLVLRRRRESRGQPYGVPLQAILLSAGTLLLVHAMVDIDWHAPANPILLLTLLATAQRDFSEEAE